MAADAVVLVEQLVDVTVVSERRGRVKVGSRKEQQVVPDVGAFGRNPAKANHYIASPHRPRQGNNISDCCGRKERSFGTVRE